MNDLTEEANVFQAQIDIVFVQILRFLCNTKRKSPCLEKSSET